MTPHGMIRLSMVMEKSRFASFQEEGVLLPDPRSLMDESFRPAYAWMASRMSERLPSPRGAVWPLWAWAWYDGFDAPRPHERGDDHLVMDILKPAECVLLSEFGSWHHVLNNWYLPDERSGDMGEAEMESFLEEAEALGAGDWPPRYPDDLQSRIEESWRRTFDVAVTDEIVQAVFFSLTTDEIVDIRPWDSRSARRRRVVASLDGYQTVPVSASAAPHRM